MTVKNNINYFSQSVVSNDDEDSRTKIDLRKFRTKFSSNKKLIDSSVEKSVHSGRVNPQKLLFKSSIQKKKEDEGSLSLNKGSRSKKHTSTYQ